MLVDVEFSEWWPTPQILLQIPSIIRLWKASLGSGEGKGGVVVLVGWTFRTADKKSYGRDRVLILLKRERKQWALTCDTMWVWLQQREQGSMRQPGWDSETERSALCKCLLDVWRTQHSDVVVWSVGWPSLLPVPSSSCLCSPLHPWHSRMQLGQGVCVWVCIFVCVYHCWESYKTVPI